MNIADEHEDPESEREYGKTVKKPKRFEVQTSALYSSSAVAS